MHTIRLVLHGKVKVAHELEVDDRDALPLFVQLADILIPEGDGAPKKRRTRKSKEAEPTTGEPATDSADASDSTESMFSDAS